MQEELPSVEACKRSSTNSVLGMETVRREPPDEE
jgi:hypothetical protein